MGDQGWTIDELARRAAEALAGDGVRAPNGRVTVVPDRRVIRWYATIGLLDRPLRTGGRIARYGPRHLRQLVAVKRRQAQGRALAEIQAELAGATDATLSRVAGLPDPPPPPPSSRSWSSGAPAGATSNQDREGDGPRERFWAETQGPTRSASVLRPVPGAATLASAPSAAESRPTSPPDSRPTSPPESRPASVGPGGPPEPVYPLPLHRAATLVLRTCPAPDDLAEIRAAARPLLDLLAARGLLAEPPPRRLP